MLSSPPHHKVAPDDGDVELGDTKTQEPPKAQVAATRSSMPPSERRMSMINPAMLAKVKKPPRYKRQLATLAHTLNHNYTQILLALVLFISLFLPDLWTIGNPANDADVALNVILIISFIVFVLEIVVTCLVRDDYFNTFFFWMDVIGTASIIIDITWVSHSVAALQSNAENGTTLRAARVAKLGAKSGRLAKLVKLFKFMNPSREEDVEKITPAHRISRQLGQMLSQRVAALIMFIIIVNPFLQTSVTDYSAMGYLTTMGQLANMNAGRNMTSSEWANIVDEMDDFYRDADSNGAAVAIPVRLALSGLTADQCPGAATYDGDGNTCVWTWDSKREHLRKLNKAIYGGSGDLSHVEAEFDRTKNVVRESVYSVLLILMVIFLLVGFTASFNHAVDRKIVLPIQRIMDTLKRSAASVLESVQAISVPEEDEEDESGMNETDVLELMVQKLARIVKKTMGKNDMQAVLDEHGGAVDESTQQWLNQDFIQSRRRESNTEKDSQKVLQEASVAPSGVTASLALEKLPVTQQEIDSFDFDILSLTADQLPLLVHYMMDRHSLLSEFQIPVPVFEAFVTSIRGGYKTEPPYHCWHHGCDVMHTVYLLLTHTHASAYMNKLEIFASLVSALAHDVGHPGVNNGFLVKTKDPLALLHNDKSPLENMHAATLYEVLRDPACDIMKSLADDQWADCRKQILTCILNTDMAVHFQGVKELSVFEEVNGVFVTEFINKKAAGEDAEVPQCLDDPANHLLIQHMFLHAADLSNPVKATHVYEKWVARVTDEFFAQGDKEKEMGIAVSPMCDRDTTNIPNMQLGFIDFIIAPFYTMLFKIFPEQLYPMADNLKANYQHYVDLRISEVGHGTEDETKLHGRSKALTAKVDDSLNLNMDG